MSHVPFEVLHDEWLASFTTSAPRTNSPTLNSFQDALREQGLTFADPRIDQIRAVLEAWCVPHSRKGKRAGLPVPKKHQQQRLGIVHAFYAFLIEERGYTHLQNPVQGEKSNYHG
jgi:hypothetical protein